MVQASNLGFPRIGVDRELKKAQEAYWKGNISESELQNTAKELRSRHWKLQKDAGIDQIPVGDFSFYDQVLDTIAMVGAVPSRYNWEGGKVDLTTFFAMARGRQADGQDVVAMEMTKWFDTNYHYIVPELDSSTNFSLASTKVIDEYEEAKSQGINGRPVIIGPVTFLLLGKSHKEEFDRLSLLPQILPVYEEVLKRLSDAGATCVQIDEPCLVLDLDEKAKQAYQNAYAQLGNASDAKLLLTTYFGALGDNLKLATSLPVDGLHIDLVRAPEQLDDVLNALPTEKTLSLGVINGRNIWKANLAEALALVERATAKRGSDNILVAGSCSLLHSPVDLDVETKLDDEIKNWLAFATQKLAEIRLVADAANGNKNDAAFAANADAIESRNTSTRIHNPKVKERYAGITEAMISRENPFGTRIAKQKASLNLPLLPTTTIGSFPQTAEIRAQRAKFRKGELTREQYDAFLEEQTIEVMKFQDDIDIDVPVHGEYERNDMVEYFGEKLSGFAFTKNGWVQSYGSRCVKPPIIFGDVERPQAMTVRWSAFAQEQTERPVKGMLTGPVTILQWSFVRDDQPREVTCKQIGLAIRDEVVDLESAGIKLIQIDEPAIREGLPLRKAEQENYLKWAVDSFRLSAAGVKDETQIHTHMCYSDFNDIIDHIAALDADVISIETSRSAMELLDAFVEFKYPNEIGPGVYDIHSPRVPAPSEMETLLRKALEVLKAEQIWVNPDCGLKTRGWEEVKTSLENMVQAAKTIRAELAENPQAASA